MDPNTWALITLVVGISTVLGMIIVLRVNAFISLITAAMLVSIMAPGAIGDKIERVATAFGNSAAGIGIVIALAAVIGQCMMESGAADRIVRAFMKLLGEKRAPVALMGSGFVLAVPVFFDTVFYLLVPLARSLYRSTRSNYLLYILAICAGGAITHTLVPPTPGPLVMADQLGIDVGLMILVGGLVAIPSAFAGLITAQLMNKWMPINIPLDTPTEGPHDTVSEEKLPGLLVSLLPVLLPVVIISANTAAATMADGEHVPRLTMESITDWQVLSSDLATTSAGKHVLGRLQLDAVPEFSDDAAKADFITSMNVQLESRDFYDSKAFGTEIVPGRDPAIPAAWRIKELLADESLAADRRLRLQHLSDFQKLAGSDQSRMKRVEFERMHRLLLEAAFPGAIAVHDWNTPKRKMADLFRLLGNANLALLLSAAVSIYVFWNVRRPTLAKLAQGIEESLMSGGAIILITAAGGAFGKMLQTAGVGDAILDQFNAKGGGVMLLLIGFGIAALMKIAQGSSTTAMIVTSGMMGAMISTSRPDFNVVYVATAIGAGSCIGSWMNDSGFWIVARMSGLTEAQALKTWTPMLAILGIVGLCSTIVLSIVLPLKGL